MLFTVVFVIHLIFSFSTVLSWLVFIGDIALIAWLTMKAYRDADTLDRYRPFETTFVIRKLLTVGRLRDLPNIILATFRELKPSVEGMKQLVDIDLIGPQYL